ncbi:hypothetical protein FRC01_001355 [Tulasnella sp. 417]|nr:hypothetical protein FRC01_001355 [Tulasnella sp. 417]
MAPNPIAPKARRISYVVPPPPTPPRRLVLPSLDTPRHGRTAPILIPVDDKSGGNTPVKASSAAASYFTHAGQSGHPQHRLGVMALALDTSTTLSGRPGPEGILYSGGRDGLLAAWEQGTSLHRRKHSYGYVQGDRSKYHWETITGWDDDTEEDDSDEEWNDVSNPAAEETIPYEDRWEPDYESLETSESVALLSKLTYFVKAGKFRQCVQAHTDWINDVVLCNYNQTVVSASNDGTLRAWNPHSSLSSDLTPSIIGDHMDYVRCLGYSRDRNWVASGSFDRTVKLWDLAQPRSEALTTLELPQDASSAKASVYALATHSSGHVIAAGSPERVIRIWDPRSGQRVSKLVGHTDNIRALLLSDDGKYVLSGSSDTTVKLWSLTAQRCLHTFTYHADSVWTLFSSHPSLEVFYSGDRSGLVCKVDVETCREDLSDAECVVICRDAPDADDGGKSAEGINKIVGMDDLYIWTATSESSIKRWTVPRRKVDRMKEFDLGQGLDHIRAESPSPVPPFLSQTSGTESPPLAPPSSTFTKSHQPRFSVQSSLSGTGTLHSTNTVGPAGQGATAGANGKLLGVPYQSLVRLAPLHETLYSGPSIRRDPDISTLYSAVSIRSVPALARTIQSETTTPGQPTPTGASLKPQPHIVTGSAATSSHASILSPDRSQAVSPEGRDDFQAARDAYEDRDLAIQAVPFQAKPNDVIQGTHGLVRSVILSDRIHALTVDTAGEVAVWDLVRGTCEGVYSGDSIGLASNASSSSAAGGRERERTPREALETVQERIEGEAMCPTWCTVDTKIGHLTVHLVESRAFDAEVYVDDTGFVDAKTFPEDHKVNIGKWVLANIFAGFVRAELSLVQQQAAAANPNPPADTETTSADAAPATNNPVSIVRGAAPTHINLTPSSEGRRLRSASELSNVIRTPGHHALGRPAMTPAIFVDLPVPGNRTASSSSGQATPIRNSSSSHHPPTAGLNKLSALTPIPASPTAATTPGASTTVARTPSTTAGKDSADYFTTAKGRARSGSVANDSQDEGSGATATPGGFMGRLRNFGKSSKRPVSADATATAIPEHGDAAPAPDSEAAGTSLRAQHLKALNAILSQTLAPTPGLEAPPLELPPETAVMIAEETSDAGGWTSIYTSVVSTLQDDLESFEMAAPIWLLELLLLNKAPTVPQTKLSFVVIHTDRKAEPIADSSRLTAGRNLRVRKVLQYVKDKLEPVDLARGKSDAKDGAKQAAATASQTNLPSPPDVKPEDMYELLCNDTVLPLTMTIGAVRHYVWRQSGELMMYYRRKNAPGSQPGA